MKSFQKFIALTAMIFVSKTVIAAPQKAVQSGSSNSGDSVALGKSNPSSSNATTITASVWEPKPIINSASNTIGLVTGNRNGTASGNINPVSVNGQHSAGIADTKTSVSPSPSPGGGDISVTTVGKAGNQKIGTASGNISPVSVNGQHSAGISDTETPSPSPASGGDVSVTAVGKIGNQKVGTASSDINPVSVNGQHGSSITDIKTDTNDDASVTNIGSVGNQINTTSSNIVPVSVNHQHSSGVHDIEADANGDISITSVGSVGNKINTTSGNMNPVSVNGQYDGAGVHDVETFTGANPSSPGSGDISATTIGEVGNQVNTTSGNIHPISIDYGRTLL